MKEQRWLRIIPVALVMYTISYVDRTNISLALDPKLSSMMRDLFMDDRMKGQAAGLFFLGYVLLQIPGGHLAGHWSAKKFISALLICWGACAVGCGLARTFVQFEVMRFLLGMAESGVFPATLVLLAHWFPKNERARANAYWNLCQPLAIVSSAQVTTHLLSSYGWQKMLIFEGMLPFIWLPVWWFFISDHPSDAKWISPEEKEYLEATLKREIAAQASERTTTIASAFLHWHRVIIVMVAICFLYNCQAYGCMTFFTSTLEGRGFTPAQYGILFAIPYAVTAVIMVLNSHHSDKTGERRGHAAAVFVLSGLSLVGSTMLLKNHFWASYALMCLAIPGPFAALAPFWAMPSETLPRNAIGPVIGLVNACGNVGGFAGPYLTGWLKQKHGIAVPFYALGIGMLVATALCFLLPKSVPHKIISPAPVPASDVHA